MKRLNRLAPNLVHMCIFIWEWIYAKQIAPRDTGGHLGGFKGVKHSKVRGSCQTARTIGTTFGTCLRIRLRIDIAKCNSPLNTTGDISRGFTGSQIQKSGEDVKRLDRLAPNLVHMCIFICEWIYAKQIAPRDTRGHLGGFRGSNIQKSGEAVKRLKRLAPHLVHVCGFVLE